jgi:hypothetical protein
LPLAAMSVPWKALDECLAGKSVALVGNARALADASHGAEIEATDIVIRINRAPRPTAESHGTRTDWLALATSLSTRERADIAPGRILWMSHKRKRLPYRIAAGDGFYLHPLEDWRALGRQLGAPPSTGAMVIDLLARSGARRIGLYGFDFFASKSLSGRRGAEQVPHDFAAEAAWVRALAENDPRFTLIPL